MSGGKWAILGMPNFPILYAGDGGGGGGGGGGGRRLSMPANHQSWRNEPLASVGGEQLTVRLINLMSELLCPLCDVITDTHQQLHTNSGAARL